MANRISLRGLVAPLGVATAIALLVSGVPALHTRLATAHLEATEQVAHHVLLQDILWVITTVLATAVAVTLAFLLIAAAATFQPPWRRSLSVAIFVLSPVIGLVVTALVTTPLTLPPGEGVSAVYIHQGWLIKYLPTILTVAAVPAFSMALRRPSHPA